MTVYISHFAGLSAGAPGGQVVGRGVTRGLRPRTAIHPGATAVPSPDIPRGSVVLPHVWGAGDPGPELWAGRLPDQAAPLLPLSAGDPTRREGRGLQVSWLPGRLASWTPRHCCLETYTSSWLSPISTLLCVYSVHEQGVIKWRIASQQCISPDTYVLSMNMVGLVWTITLLYWRWINHSWEVYI